MRVAFGVCVALLCGACGGKTIDLGGGNAVPSPNGSSSASVAIATCPDPTSTSAVQGNGYSSVRPALCGGPSGTAASVTSADQVASLLVGVWYDCTDENFGMNLGVRAFELTSSGQYAAYTDGDDTLVPTSEVDDGSGTATTGTFTVIDGSATYGPGTYELQLRPSSGGLFSGQVVVTGNPGQIEYFGENQAEQVFSPPLPWSPRKGVCSCIDTSAAAFFQDDATALANAITGQWMWCAGLGPPAGNIGIEFAAGNTWYGLNEDASGNITRDDAPLDHGTFQFVPTSTLNVQTVGPEPLTLELHETTQSELTQIVYVANPRVLLFATATYSGPGGTTNGYVTCLPMP